MDWSLALSAVAFFALWVGVSWFANRKKPTAERRRIVLIEAAIAVVIMALLTLYRQI